MTLAAILLVPSIAALWQAWQKFLAPTAPAATPLSLVGVGALIVNFSCAAILTRIRAHSGSLTSAAFLSARNDVIANVAIIAAGVLTSYTLSAWPHLIVGFGIIVINAGAAWQVWSTARREHNVAKP